MSADKSSSDGGKSVPSLGNELVGLVLAYVKQETVDPIKALGRFVAFGVAGALLLAVGGGVLTLAAVRAAQAETGSHLHGNYTWVPYGAGMLLALIGAGWAVSRIGKVGK